MPGTLTPSEEAQLQQTVEMFEAIAQSQPHDYQSLEILKEAYLKLGRDADLLDASKRIADAYVQLGQLSSAILEYETILQRFPDDPDVSAALARIESQATSLGGHTDEEPEEGVAAPPEPPRVGSIQTRASTAHLDDGSGAMKKLFVDGNHISSSEFDLCWPDAEALGDGEIVVPFIQSLADKNMMPLEKALKLLVDKCRLGYLTLEMYDIQIDLSRSYSAEVCRRWCVLPFDQIGKTVLVSTTNPFNARAMHELQQSQGQRIQWYLAAPADLTREIQKAFRS
jgi:tetratricopeptide (TPR) repeat protein